MSPAFEYFRVPQFDNAECDTSKHPDISADWFFVDEQKDGRYETRLAIRYCKSCSHINECLGYALDQNIQYGVWGGMTSPERRQLLQRMEGNGRLYAIQGTIEDEDVE